MQKINYFIYQHVNDVLILTQSTCHTVSIRTLIYVIRRVHILSKNVKIKICITIILPVVLYGCETWSLTLRVERRLRVFENRVLRRISGPKRDKVSGECRKLHYEKLNP